MPESEDCVFAAGVVVDDTTGSQKEGYDWPEIVKIEVFAPLDLVSLSRLGAQVGGSLGLG